MTHPGWDDNAWVAHLKDVAARHHLTVTEAALALIGARLAQVSDLLGEDSPIERAIAGIDGEIQLVQFAVRGLDQDGR